MPIKLEINDPRLALPASVTTRDGFVFDPHLDCWKIPNDGSKWAILNFLDLYCDAALLAALKMVLIDFLEFACHTFLRLTL